MPYLAKGGHSTGASRIAVTQMMVSVKQLQASYRSFISKEFPLNSFNFCKKPENSFIFLVLVNNSFKFL